jgi:transposase InsO family protein
MGKEARAVAYRFLEEKKDQRRILRACRLLGVCRSSYYAWKTRPLSRRAKEDLALTQKILEIHRQSKGVYGAPRIWAELKLKHGVRCSRKRVARLMRVVGIAGAKKGRPRGTTRSEGKGAPHPDLVNRNFAVEAPNRLWVADLTQHPTEEGWLYLATVIDAFSRRVVGWSMGERAQDTLVVEALNMAIARRKPASGLIHHSDRGSQYTSLGFTQRLRETGILGSMGRAGSAFDNALAESFYATLQTELLDRRRWQTRAELKLAIFEYIEGFYNRRRRHSALGYLSPEEFERRWSQNQEGGIGNCNRELSTKLSTKTG